MMALLGTSLTLMMTFHPLSMALLLMLNTLIIALMSGMMNISYWYAFMLFMIMVGGMLVMIIYMTTIASNEYIDLTFKYLIPLMILSMLMCLPNILNLNFMINTPESYLNPKPMNLSLNKFISANHLSLIMMLINYLFITLIAIVKITSLKYGSLRQKF
nr:NADH dehydrogenase subunit 6 [Bostrichoidea sp. KM-2015]